LTGAVLDSSVPRHRCGPARLAPPCVAQRPTTCPWAVNSMRRSSPIRPDDDLPRVEPDADRERHAILGVDLGRERAGGVTQMECRVAGARCVILVGDRRAEQRHAAVPRELVHEALAALDAIAQDAEEALHDLRPRLGVELLRHLHRALHVDEENGDLLALALDRGFRLTDLVGEERRMGWRWRRR